MEKTTIASKRYRRTRALLTNRNAFHRAFTLVFLASSFFIAAQSAGAQADNVPETAALESPSAENSPAQEITILLTGDTFSATGYFQLAWEPKSPADAEWILEEARSKEFVEPIIIYEGPDRGSAVTGREDGIYHFRVRDAENKYVSEILTVEVEHHPLGRAFFFLALGFVVFLSTAILIVAGHRLHRKEVTT